MPSESYSAFFAQPADPLQRRYEVLRAFFLEGLMLFLCLSRPKTAIFPRIRSTPRSLEIRII